VITVYRVTTLPEKAAQPVRRPAGVTPVHAVSTPIFDRLCWERGQDPLSPVAGRPRTADVLSGIIRLHKGLVL
jgi:hypothetical protein